MDCAKCRSYGALTRGVRRGSRPWWNRRERGHALCSKPRGHLMVTSLEGQDTGAMAAIMAPAETVSDALIDGDKSVVLANMNQPKQTVISGPTKAIEAMVKTLRRARLPGGRKSQCRMHFTRH